MMFVPAFLALFTLMPPTPFPADDGAWAKLPPPKDPRLPEWARVLAGPLPKTTAKMLELDYYHRERNPLGKNLAAKIRYVVADALGCEYGKAAAKAEFEMPHSKFQIQSDPPDLRKVNDYLLVEPFARKLTLEGHAITDEEFAEVLKHFGPAKTTAIVHTVAYANFHNRVLLGLGVKGESPIAPPVAIKFDTDAKLAAPPRPPWDDLKEVKSGGLAVRVDWSAGDAAAMAKKLEAQKARPPRMPLPDKSAYDHLTPKEQDSSRRIMWNTVSMGYQPDMVRAWFACLYTYYGESNPERVFTNSAFWVVTRTNDCFY
jgi:alkylhydroperoxidase family enzyme